MYSDKAEAVLECIREQKSVRTYADRPVPDSIIQSIIHAGIEAPTAMSLQPLRFVVIRDRGLIKRISDFCKDALSRALSSIPLSMPDRSGRSSGIPGTAFFSMHPSSSSSSGINGAPSLCSTAHSAQEPCSLPHQRWVWVAAGWDQLKLSQKILDCSMSSVCPEHFRIMAPLIFGCPAAMQPKKTGTKEPFTVRID